MLNKSNNPQMQRKRTGNPAGEILKKHPVTDTGSGRGGNPTIRQVAARSGVSIATVSAVINSTRYVSADTAARVNAAIAAIGYRPNRLARGLSSSKTRTIGILMPTILSPTAPLLLKSASDALHAHGFSVMFSNTEMHASWEMEATEFMFDSQVDGLLTVPATGDSSALELFSRARKPVVLMLHGIKGNTTYDVVRSGNFKGSFDAVSHLIDQGSTRVALLALPPDTLSETERIDGYKTALMAAGMTPEPELIQVGAPSESGLSERDGFDLTRKLMELPSPPDAIFAMNQYMAIGCLAALKELRLRVPDDIAVVGYDDLIWTKHLQPALSTVSQQIEEIGRLAAERLIHRLNYGEEPVTATSITVDTKLIIRASSDRHRELNSQ